MTRGPSGLSRFARRRASTVLERTTPRIMRGVGLALGEALTTSMGGVAVVHLGLGSLVEVEVVVSVVRVCLVRMMVEVVVIVVTGVMVRVPLVAAGSVTVGVASVVVVGIVLVMLIVVVTTGVTVPVAVMVTVVETVICELTILKPRA